MQLIVHVVHSNFSIMVLFRRFWISSRQIDITISRKNQHRKSQIKLLICPSSFVRTHNRLHRKVQREEALLIFLQPESSSFSKCHRVERSATSQFQSVSRQLRHRRSLTNNSHCELTTLGSVQTAGNRI